MSDEMVVIYTARDNAEADIIKGILEEEGIPVFVQGYNHRSLLGLVGSYIDINVMVSENEAERAIQFIARTEIAVPGENDSPERKKVASSGDAPKEEYPWRWLLAIILLFLFLLCGLSFGGHFAHAKELPPPPDCNIKPTQAVTKPEPVALEHLILDLNALTTMKGQKMLDAEKLRHDLQQIFDISHPNSKLQQFYRLLFMISQNSLADIGMGVDFDVVSARKILVTARVFSDPAFPSRITAIRLDSTGGTPEYTVSFSDATERFPLNRGAGFRSWDDGYCQHARELVFARRFSFKMKEVRGGNLKVYKFIGVDLFGDFGTRGVVDVDLKYVRLSEVEFVKNSNLGHVTAYISQKEFQESKHNVLLRLVSQIIPNTSLQAIDW